MAKLLLEQSVVINSGSACSASIWSEPTLTFMKRGCFQPGFCAQIYKGPSSLDLERVIFSTTPDTCVESLFLDAEWPGFSNLIDFPRRTRVPFLGLILFSTAFLCSF